MKDQCKNRYFIPQNPSVRFKK